MRCIHILGLSVLGVLFAHPAEALTISNTDPDPHTVKVTVGGKSEELTVAPEKEIQPSCDKGCVIELSGEQYEMQGGEEVSIEDGTLFVDMVPGMDEGDVSDGDAPDSDAPADAPATPGDEGPDAAQQ